EYNYNRKNQLVSRTWDGGYAAYHYDRQGNLLEAAGTEGNTLFAYNVFNRQTAVTMPDGGRLENRYDAEGLRAGTVENSVETRFLYFNGELLSELDEAGDTISRYILGYGATAVWNRGKEGYHPCHLDEQNSTAYITGLDGEIKNSYQYDAFGNLQNRNITVRNRILYTGQQYDEITGQYYLRARFYHPAVGRFLQEDVYRGDGLNLYAYCANNPVVYYDPSGYAPNCKEDGEETATPPTVGLEDIQYARENIMRSEKDTIAVGKTDVEGLESQQPFIGGSRQVRRDAGLDSLDVAMPDRDIRAPYKSALFTNHAEEDVLSQFDKAVLELGKDPATISGNLVIAQSHPKGICTLCVSGIKNPGRSTGIFKQFSERYPNLTISVSTASETKAISTWWKSFTIKAGKLIGEPKI
ncbi:MAG: RHS repeat-associated core domain-containing protein, partial [Lachnospiraceae bacterium]|nr:RHS repeat-associated core domain-containing protein [Lachnospiraceae bacterium]